MNDIKELKIKIDKLEELLNALSKKSTYSEKVVILNELPIVKHYLSLTGPIQDFLKRLSPEPEYAIKAIIAIGQAPIIFNIKEFDEHLFKKLLALLEQLLEIEVFYEYLGGIIGYHYTILTQIYLHLNPVSPSNKGMNYIQPKGLDLEKDNLEVRQAIRFGIENVQHIAEIYPLGGAGDRLNLKNEETGEFLPAALLPFLGHSLLDGMLRDLQAREYLTFKLLGKQHITPVAIMTSIEKNNHIHVLDICKKANWFGRGEENFYFFIQPLVPVITIEGNWSLSSPLNLTLKPNGHGVLWKLAKETGVFNWLESQGRHQCLIRQINNPLAATDQGILALIGIGCTQNKTFGFLSCERLLNSDEGTNILIEKKGKQGYDYCLTNIEYTEFAQRGIGEIPAKPGSLFSIYPANTNILFINLNPIQKILKICPIPGQLINMKSKVPYINPEGDLSYIHGGRLESTMQNIADHIVDHSPHQLKKDDQKALQTFILYNSRSKTISPTKKSYKIGESPISTPEQAFYDLISNHYALLKQCQFKLPPWKKIEDYLLKGPSFIFLFHPGLGPLYSIVTQKIRKGSIAHGAELQLEIAEVDIEDLSLTGSLIIRATTPLGTFASSGILQFGNESRCSLKKVTIENQGIDHSLEQQYWKNSNIRKEEVTILLHEGGEFHAENIILKGSHTFEVPAHNRLVLKPDDQGNWKADLFPIRKPTWYWRYTFDGENRVQLKKIKTRS